jgi:hypothetical protein
MKTLHELIAEKLEHNPLLLQVALDNIDRWLADGYTAPHRLEQWRQILLRAQQFPDGMDELVAFLQDRSERSQRLKDFAPFAGVLTREERRQASPECAYNF